MLPLGCADLLLTEMCHSLCLLQRELSEFSSFNYWRAPIAAVDALLADLLLWSQLTSDLRPHWSKDAGSAGQHVRCTTLPVFFLGGNWKCGALWTLWLTFGKINSTCDGAADVWRTASPSQVSFTCRTEGDDVTCVTRPFNFPVFEQTPVKITLFCFVCAFFLLLKLFRLTTLPCLLFIYLFV